MYYERQRGTFERADMVYLKQDFSVVQPVPDAAPWPTLQRFDYLTRKRELTKEELEGLRPGEKLPAPADYPQRQAVLWALCELTGENAGGKSAGWYRALLGWSCGVAF
jgi:hypothetical protein